MNFGRTLFVALCVLGTASASHAGIITNGSFEDLGAQSFQNGTWGLFGWVPGWSSGTGAPLEIGLGTTYGVTGYHGSNVLELDSTGNAVVSQNLLAPGGLYNVNFLAALRGTTDKGPASMSFDVLWNSLLVGSFTPGSTVMTRYSVNVVATGNDTLAFQGTGTSDSFGAIIDDVRVPDGGATLALLGMALGGLGFLRRRML